MGGKRLSGLRNSGVHGYYYTMGRALGRIASVLIVVTGWMMFIIRLVLDIIGYSTVPEDIEVARTRFDQALDLLLSAPWWAFFVFAMFSTVSLMWFSWPRQISAAAKAGIFTPHDEDDLADAKMKDEQPSWQRCGSGASLEFVDETVEYLTGLYKDKTQLQGDLAAGPYIGKGLRLEGNISEIKQIGSNAKGPIAVTISYGEGHFSFPEAILFFDRSKYSRLLNLRPGKTIKAHGKINAISRANVALTQCEIED